jgi:hypothetical protein
VNVLERVRRFFRSTEELDVVAQEELEREREEREAATSRANRAFDRHGPSDVDLLPGSPRAKVFRRRR